MVSLKWIGLLAVLAVGVRADPGAEFAQTLAGAGWQEAASGVVVRSRKASLFSPGMLAALRAADTLGDDARAALRDVARVTFPEPGWFAGVPVDAGTYRLGFEAAGDDFRCVMRDAAGEVLTAEDFWIDTTTDAVPSCTVAQTAEGLVTLRLSTGGIDLKWKYVAHKRHEEVLGTLVEAEAGRVVLRSDIAEPETLARIAREADAAIDGFAALLGRPAPDRRFRITLLYDAERLAALESLLTEGEFADRWGFASHLTREAYVRWVPIREPGVAIPLSAGTRAAVLHELFHLVAGAVYPRQGTHWPLWLQEGLAELGAERALRAADPPAAAGFRATAEGDWANGQRTGTAPQVEDLLGGSVAGGVRAYYAASHLRATRVAGRPADLRAIVARASGEARPRRARLAARAELEGRFGPVGELCRSLGGAGDDPPPSVTNGYVEPRGDALLVLSPSDGAVRAVFPALHEGPDLSAELAFAWLPVGQRQADLYLAYAEGKHVARFLKVAVMPKAILLFHYAEGDWSTVGRVDYDTALETGTVEAPCWHPLRVRYDAAERTLRIDTTGGRWARFRADEYVPTAATRMGVGAYRSAVLWRGIPGSG